MTDKPNILLIMCDQHRFDCLSCMGNPILKTPNIDRIAEQGYKFENAYCPSPICAPARAAIKSGLYPPGCGVVTNWVEFKPNTELMTQRLQKLGYETALSGKLHFVPAENQFGFDWKKLHDAPYSIYADDQKHSDYFKWLKQNYYPDENLLGLFNEDEGAGPYHDQWHRFTLGSNFRTEEQHDIPWVTTQSINFLEQRDKNNPFFLFTSYFGPHQPYAVPEPWKHMYDPDEIPLPSQFNAEMQNNPVFQTRCTECLERFQGWTEKTYREIIADYYGQIAMIDHYIGNLFEYLDENRLWDNTLVIFLADHGDHNGAYRMFFKGDMYDSCAKVPLLIKPPNSNSHGQDKAEVVNTLDLYGTILDYAGDTDWRKPDIESRSLKALLEKKNIEEWKNETYAVFGQNPNNNLTMFRRDNMKLIRLAQGKAEAIYELYDMNDEVVEIRNVYDCPQYSDSRNELKNDLDKWYHQQAEKYPTKKQLQQRSTACEVVG